MQFGGSLEAERAVVSPAISLREEGTHLEGRLGLAGHALHPQADVIKKDTSKTSSYVTACLKASEILLTEKKVSFQVPYVKDSEMAEKYFTDV